MQGSAQGALADGIARLREVRLQEGHGPARCLLTERLRVSDQPLF